MKPANDAPDPAPPQDTDAEVSYPEFGEWFTAEFIARGMSNKAVLKLFESVGGGGRYKSGDITNMKKGRQRPNETGAAVLAAAWGLPESLVLRKAGYEDTAAFRERHRGDADRLLTTIRGSGLPETEQHDLEGELALVEEFILLKIEKLRRATEKPPNADQQDAS